MSVSRTARVLVFAWATLVLVFVYWQFREAPATAVRLASHRSVIDGTAPSPYRYRVLGPWTAELTSRALAPGGERPAFHLAYLAWNGVWVLLTFMVTFRLLRRWHPPERALAGTLLLPLPLMAGFAEQWYAPWSVAETPLFVGGVVAILEGRTVLALAVVAAATLNRETALYVPLAWAALSMGRMAADAPAGTGRRTVGGAEAPERGGRTADSPRWPGALGALLVWGVVYGALRVARGAADPAVPRAELMQVNLDRAHLFFTALWLLLLLGPFWLWVPAGLRRAPGELRRLCLVALPVIGLWLAFGIWREVRILLPLVPLALAVGLFAPRPSSADGPGAN